MVKYMIVDRYYDPETELIIYSEYLGQETEYRYMDIDLLRYGAVDSEDNLILPALYQKISIINGKYILAETTHLSRILFNLSGRPVIDYEFSEISIGSDSFFVRIGRVINVVRNDGSLIDSYYVTEDSIIIDDEEDEEDDGLPPCFSEYMRPIYDEKNTHVFQKYIDFFGLYETEEEERRYEYADIRMETVLPVQKGDKQGIVRIDGTILAPFKFDRISRPLPYYKTFSFKINNQCYEIDKDMLLNEDFVIP